VINQLSAQAKMTPTDTAATLSRALPATLDKLSPKTWGLCDEYGANPVQVRRILTSESMGMIFFNAPLASPNNSLVHREVIR